MLDPLNFSRSPPVLETLHFSRLPPVLETLTFSRFFPLFPTVLENLERDLRKHRPRYALLEHIHSQPAICLPIEDMVQLCRDYGVEEIAIDGAHGVGSIPDLDVPSIGADFYYSNLHKWGSYSLSLSFLCLKNRTPFKQVSALTHQLWCMHVKI